MMKRLIRYLLAALGFCSGCSKSPVLSPGQFTGEFAETLRVSSPQLRVEVVADLQLHVTSPDGHEWTSYLHNVYDMYKENPSAKGELIRKFIASSEEMKGVSDEVDRTCIVPVIKDRPWLEETRRAMLEAAAKEALDYVWDDFNRDLVVVYGEDSAANIRYFKPEDVRTAGIHRSELRALACENLKRLLPKIECHGSNGLYMVTAGGDYEASLLLLDSIWSSGQMDVRGDIVVAIPTRDLLLVTGSQYPEGVAKVKQMARDAYDKGAYRLTPKLFVCRSGGFVEFMEEAEPVVPPPVE